MTVTADINTAELMRGVEYLRMEPPLDDELPHLLNERVSKGMFGIRPLVLSPTTLLDVLIAAGFATPACRAEWLEPFRPGPPRWPR